MKEWKPDFWYINILHQPDVFDVQQLPTTFKDKVAQKIKKCSIYKKEIESAVFYLTNTPDHVVDNWQEKLRSVIKSVDYVRKENFAKVFPELEEEFKIYE